MSDAQQRLGFLSRLHSTSFRDDLAAARNRVLDGWRARHADGEGRFALYRALGCEACTKEYRRRVGLHELMLGADALKRLMLERARVAARLSAALEDGMLTLKWMVAKSCFRHWLILEW